MSRCSRVQPHTRTHHTHDQNTTGIPAPVIYPKVHDCIKSMGLWELNDDVY
ncbi:hypothetical protein L208DRAFT_1254845 [Tricholoma matsutake]|nr:hypothetical protein L208DRAFT_1254845 [Tricholoma matsutake 945]